MPVGTVSTPVALEQPILKYRYGHAGIDCGCKLARTVHQNESIRSRWQVQLLQKKYGAPVHVYRYKSEPNTMPYCKTWTNRT